VKVRYYRTSVRCAVEYSFFPFYFVETSQRQAFNKQTSYKNLTQKTKERNVWCALSSHASYIIRQETKTEKGGDKTKNKEKKKKEEEDGVYIGSEVDARAKRRHEIFHADDSLVCTAFIHNTMMYERRPSVTM